MPDVLRSGETLRDSLFHEYVPRAPTVGKWRPHALLEESTRSEAVGEHVRDLSMAFRSRFGADRTVWRVVSARDGDLSWEFNWFRPILDPPASLEIIDECLTMSAFKTISWPDVHPFTGVTLVIRSDQPGPRYHADLQLLWGEASGAAAQVVRVVPHNGAKEIVEILHPYESPVSIEDLGRTAAGSFNAGADCLHLFDGWKVFEGASAAAVGYGMRDDTLYLVGIDYDAFLSFLDQTDFDASLRSRFRSNQGNLDHLAYDVSMSYVVQGSNLMVTRSSFYGVA